MKKITLEEYQSAIERLKIITEEKELLLDLNEDKKDFIHFSIPSTFEELLLGIKRENEQLDYKINLEKKRFLASLNRPQNFTKLVDIEIMNLVDQVVSSPINEESDVFKFLMSIPNFLSFYWQFLKFNSLKMANLDLESYVLILQSQEAHCKKVKKDYEKQCKSFTKTRKRL